MLYCLFIDDFLIQKQKLDLWYSQIYLNSKSGWIALELVTLLILIKVYSNDLLTFVIIFKFQQKITKIFNETPKILF